MRLVDIGWAIALSMMAATAAGAERPEALSPNGELRAFTRPEGGPHGANGDPASSLWLEDRRTGRSRLLLRGHLSNDEHRDTVSLSNPDFSLDGGFVYVESAAYATSPAIHQVNVVTGRERFVVDGALVGILRTGPLRGFLIVEQHRYRRDGNGSFDPIIIVRPDGRQVAIVPGTEGRNPNRALVEWLAAKRWIAS